MKKDDLSKMNSTQLIDMFIAICERQLIAATDFKNVIYNKLFENMRQIVLELRSRSGDHRRLLIPLTSHANPQVRLKAAIHTLAIDRDAAVAALQALADRGEFPTAMDARGILRGLQDGTFIAS